MNFKIQQADSAYYFTFFGQKIGEKIVEKQIWPSYRTFCGKTDKEKRKKHYQVRLIFIGSNLIEIHF
jgi:hypothetical protein